MSQDVQRVRVVIFRGDHFELAIAIDHSVEIENRAVELDGDRLAGQARADGLGGLAATDGLTKLQYFAVGKREVWHGKSRGGTQDRKSRYNRRVSSLASSISSSV